MPAAVSETGVRAPAHAPASGMRPHGGADQASSPFSALLDNCEVSGTEAPDPAAVKAPAIEGDPDAEAAVLDTKAQKPETASQKAPAKNAGQAEAELALAIVGAVERQAGQPVTVAETKPETDEPPAHTDTPETADAPSAPQPAPVIVAPVPVPAALPALGDAAAVVPETDGLAVAAAATAQPAVTPAIPAAAAGIADLAAPVADKTSAPAAAVAVTVASKAAAPVAGDAEPSPAKRAAGKSAPPVGVATGVTAEAASAATEAKSPDKTTADRQPVNDVATRSNRSSEAAANAPRNIETPANAPTITAAEAVQDVAANTQPLPAPASIATSAPQLAQVPHQAVARDGIAVAGLAVEIAAHAQAGKNHFEIRLDPPELGRIDVRLQVDGDGQVTSHVRVERAETLDLLRRDAPQLERALQQAGLKTSEGGMQFSLRDQSFSQRDQGQTMPSAARIVVPDETLATIETQRSYGRLAGLGSGVDIRV